MKPKIHLVLSRPDGHRSEIEITGDPVTATMLDAAEALFETLTTGEPAPLPKGFYDLVAQAFNTKRDDAKRRLLGAMYGKRGKKITP
jgi:hypothetical protein